MQGWLRFGPIAAALLVCAGVPARSASGQAAPLPEDLELQGVVAAGDPSRGTAVISSGGRTRVVSIGERAFGTLLLGVDADRILVEYQGRRFEIGIEAGRGGLEIARQPVEAAAATGAPATTLLTLDRADVEARLAAEIPRILQQTTLVPVRERGGVVGFSLTRFPEDSLLGDAGLRPGDIVTEINDVAIDSLQALISLWPAARVASQLHATVLRDGQLLELAVTLR